MNRRVDLDDWQHVRAHIRPLQLAILTRDFRPADPSAQYDAPAGSRKLRTHRARTDEEWQAITDGVRALLVERVHSGRWTWRDPVHLTISEPSSRPPNSTEVGEVAEQDRLPVLSGSARRRRSGHSSA